MATALSEPVSLSKSRRKESDARWRAGISSCFEILRNIIPNGKLYPKKKISKALILKETGNHISFLEKVIKILLNEIASSNDPSCENLKMLSLQKIKQEFFDNQMNPDYVNPPLNTSRSATGKSQKRARQKTGKHKRLNPRFSSLETDLALAVCVRETELRDSLNRSGRDILASRRRALENEQNQQNTGNTWTFGKLASSAKGKENRENVFRALYSDETSTPQKQMTSHGLPGLLPYTLSPIVQDGEYFGPPPPTPTTPLEGGVFSFNFNDLSPSPSGLTPIKLLQPSAIPLQPMTPGSGSETESATETPNFKYGDNSRLEDNVGEAEKSLLCQEKFENIDFEEGTIEESPFRLIARRRRKTEAATVPSRPDTPPNATPPMKRSMDMMYGRPPPKCRRKLEESFPEPTVQDNEHKLSEGNDFDGFLVFYKQLIGQLEKYLTPEEIKSKATFTMISKMWKTLPPDQKNTVIAMAMMEEFISSNESLDDDLKDLAVVPIDISPHKVEVVCPDMDEFYARAIQEVLLSDAQQVPDVPLFQGSEDRTNDVEMFEVPTATIKQEYMVSPQMALETAACLESDSNGSQASASSGSFVPTFTNLKMEPTLDDLDFGIDRDLFTVTGLYSNQQRDMWTNISLDKMMESD